MVAAGNPSKVILEYAPSLQLRKPQGIVNGDFLLAKEILRSEISPNDYIIIEVDSETYKKYEDSSCDYKLRKALLPVKPYDRIDTIIESLKNPEFHHNLILLVKYQDLFKEKYDRTRRLYPTDDLNSSMKESQKIHDGSWLYSVFLVCSCWHGYLFAKEDG